MTCDRVVSGLILPLWEEVFWLFLDALDSVRLRTASTQWNVPGRYGPCGELFFFLLKEEPMVLSELVRFGNSIPVEPVKACALIGLHMIIEKNSSRKMAPLCRQAVRMKTTWSNDALFVIGLHGSGDTIALFLQDWEVAKVALSCHVALDMLCQELHEVERIRGCAGF